MTRSRYDYGSEGVATQDFIPDTDNLYDLGSSTKEFKDLYLDGVAYLDKAEISPQGAAVPTASSLAIQDNSTSGSIAHIKSTAASASTVTGLTIELDGSNYGAGSSCLKLIADDSSTVPLLVTDGSSTLFELQRDGDLLMSTGNVVLQAGGSIITTGNGNLTLLPNGTGITIIGDAGATSHTLNTNDDLFVSGRLEVDGTAYFDGSVRLANSTIVNAGQSLFFGSTANTAALINADVARGQLVLATGTDYGQQLVLGTYGNVGSNYDHTETANPTLYVHSATDPDTDNTEFATVKWDECSIAGDNGSYFGLHSITEEVTIAVGTGNSPVVTSATNLAPANSVIRGVAVRVTQAPGGGATVVSVGRTGGNTDEFIDDISTALGTTGNSVANNDGALVAEDLWNATDATFDITTDADVTGTDMKIRIVVFYEQITSPTS
jgi:hypothetical protein